MRRAVSIAPAGTWRAPAADRIVLDYDGRSRRRMAMTGSEGLAFLLDIPAPKLLRDGDGIVLDDGRIVEVRAALEPLMEITCSGSGELARIAWHLGNRHLPAEISQDRLLVRADHVIARMLTGLGARVVYIEAPFNPEGGAYGHGQPARHEHGARGHV